MIPGDRDHDEDDPTEAPRRRPPAWVRAVAVGAGLILFAAAIVAVVRQRELIAGALDAVTAPSLPSVVLLAGAIAVNVVLTGLLFTVLIGRYGRVGVLEMQALIAGATLLNFLPLRPGLFGRVAYHRAFNEIPATSSVKVVVQAMALSLAVAAYLALVLLACRAWPGLLWPGLALPVAALAPALAWPPARRWATAGLLRYLEVFVWAVRYAAAFSLLGSPIDVTSALAFAAIACVAMLVPFVGNGLGVREWATGAGAPLLTAYVMPLGLAAELVNRACEIVVVSALGTIGLAVVGRRITARPNLTGDS